MIPASLLRSVMLKLGKLITPKTDVTSLTLEEFSVNGHEMARSISSTGKAFVTKRKICKRDLSQCLRGKCTVRIENGKYVLKKMKENQIHDIEQLFNSVEDHTRKAVQTNSLA